MQGNSLSTSGYLLRIVVKKKSQYCQQTCLKTGLVSAILTDVLIRFTKLLIFRV